VSLPATCSPRASSATSPRTCSASAAWPRPPRTTPRRCWQRCTKPSRAALEQRQDQLKIELAAAPEAEPTRLHPNLAEIYRSKVAALHEALADEASRDEAFELIRSLIDKVVVTPTEGDLHIDLHGELAGILSLCRERRRNGPLDAETVAQIKVVAGAGFEPATFRL
jgi:site-specific DNA recombinase